METRECLRRFRIKARRYVCSLEDGREYSPPYVTIVEEKCICEF